MADTATNRVIKEIGPLTNGVRPFTINGTETLAYTTATGFLGFEVSSITSGQRLYTVPVQGFSSHGITLSPDEKEIYVIDGNNRTNELDGEWYRYYVLNRCLWFQSAVAQWRYSEI